MQPNMDFLVLYAEITMAFIAFVTIVATLRQSFGGRLTPLQMRLFRFFAEAGFLHLVNAIIPIALSSIRPVGVEIWLVSTYVILLGAGSYMTFYIHRRRKIKTPLPLLSRLVIVGYGVAIIMMILTATQWFWAPSLATTTYYLLWGLLSNIALFLYFVGTFVETGPTDPNV